MSKFTKYIKRYWRSTESLAGGLNTSIKVFFRKKVTEQYPENRHTTLYIPERHRAQLEMIHNDRTSICVACGLCQMACPNDTDSCGIRGEGGCRRKEEEVFGEV